MKQQGKTAIFRHKCKQAVRTAGQTGSILAVPFLLAACSSSAVSSGPTQLNGTTTGMSLTLTPHQVNKSIMELTAERQAQQGIAGRLSGD